MSSFAPFAAPTRRKVLIGLGAATAVSAIAFGRSYTSARSDSSGPMARWIPHTGGTFVADSGTAVYPNIPADTNMIRTAGYSVPGDGGSALYQAVAAEPTHRYKFQAADGRWFELSRSQPLSPEMFGATVPGTDASRPITDALGYAGARDPLTGSQGAAAQGVVHFKQMYLYSTEIVVPAGVAVTGARSSGIKRIDEVRTTTTSAISAGADSKVFTVQDAAGLEVGQSIMIITGDRIAPVDPFAHLNPIITAIDGNRITIDPRSWIQDHPSGSILQTATHGFILAEGARVEGITIDGNGANQTDAHWQAHNEITIEGDNCVVRDVHIKDAPSDAILIGGTEARRQVDSKVLGCTFTNIGNNAVHYSYMRVGLVAGCTFRGTNKRTAGIASIHQDGAVIYSSDCTDINVNGCDFEDCLSGVGSLNSSSNPKIENDNVVVTGNTFRRCARPLYVLNETRRVVFASNRVWSDYPFTGYDRNEITVGSSSAAGPRDVVIADNQITNGKIVIGAWAQSASVTGNYIDNSQALKMVYGAIEIRNSNNVSVVGNTVIGSPYGIHIQNNFGPELTTSRNIRITGNQLIDQRWRGISTELHQTATKVDVVASDNSFRTTAAVVGTASYRAILFVPGVWAIDNSITIEVGTAFAGTGTENRRGNIVNGVVEASG